MLLERPFARLADEVLDRCDRLGFQTERPGELTRTFLSEPMHAVHEALGGWMAEAGLSVRRDAAGNLIGRREGPPGAPALLIGSHLDTVPNAGRYDGALGVLLGVAAATATRERPLPFALEVIGFSEEEGVRFGVPFLGSRAAAGRFDPALLELRDAAGVSVASAIRAFGEDPAAIRLAAYRAEGVLGYLEVHIEQGPVLESLDAPLGVVSAISGQSRVNLRLAGQAAHAGTTPMAGRRDALAGAAAVVLAAERLARRRPGLVATVGQIAVGPGASNVIPGEARLSLDVRHESDEVREGAVADLLDTAWQIAQRRKLKLEFDMVLEQVAVRCDPELIEVLAGAVEASEYPLHVLPSGAGHDAMVMAGLTRAAMLFVRSPGGLSHHPRESVHPGDVEAALEVTVGFIERLGHEGPGLEGVGSGGD